MKMQKESLVLLVFAVILIVATTVSVYQARQERLRYDKPLVDKTGDFYLCRVFYGNGHYFVACFDSPEELEAFTKLGITYTTASLVETR